VRAKTNNRPDIENYTGGITLEDFISRLDKVAKQGKNYMARCPAHSDGRPSLRIGQGDKGILINCYAGCTYHEIVAAMDLNPQDLFTDALTEKSKAQYQYRGLLADIKKLETMLWFYEQAMKNGTICGMEKEKYRQRIGEKINKHNELDALVGEYGFEKIY